MKMHRQIDFLLAGSVTLLLGSFAATAFSDDEIESYYLNQPLQQQPSHSFELNHTGKPWESVKFSDDLRIKGWQVGDGVYFGSAKIAGENGPGLIFEQEGYSWGFNHQGIALHIPL
jgi:hypothetical protein